MPGIEVVDRRCGHHGEAGAEGHRSLRPPRLRRLPVVRLPAPSFLTVELGARIHPPIHECVQISNKEDGPTEFITGNYCIVSVFCCTEHFLR